MKINEIDKVCLIGAGTVSCWNSLVMAHGGYECIIYDISEDMLASGSERQLGMVQMAIDMGLFTEEQVNIARQRISYNASLESALQGADLISESIPEKIELKRQVHAQLDDLADEGAILTTNTSSLLVSEIECAVSDTRKARFAAMHFAYFGRIMEIVPGEKTASTVVDTLKRFLISCDQAVVVLKKEKDGYLANSLLIQRLKTAILLVADGYGSVVDVDRSDMGCNNPIGPLAAIDVLGIPLCIDVLIAKYNRDGDKSFKQAADYLQENYVDKGKLGVSSGEGFYTYPSPAWQQPDFVMKS